jgi:hypothetical protein
VNPKIPTDYAEVGRWIWNFATSHVKREDSRLEVLVDMEDARERRSYGLRLVLGPWTHPAAEEPPLEFDYLEVAAGRTRFSWCEALARRLRAEGRSLAARAGVGGSRSA